jgi:UDP-N-acetylglucosamine:LPS N-acetylglucosamine transferase
LTLETPLPTLEREPTEKAVKDGGSKTVDVLLVCSAGGHLLQLLALAPAWRDLSCAWVSFDKPDVCSLLASEQVFFAHGPTNRNIPNLLKNIPLSWRLLRRLRPAVLVTTGAGVAVPFALFARLLGFRVIYVESLARIDKPSLSCRLISPVATRVYVQWPDLLEALPRAHYVGSALVLR